MHSLPPELIDRIAGELSGDSRDLNSLARISRQVHAAVVQRLKYNSVRADISNTSLWNKLAKSPRLAGFVYRLRLHDDSSRWSRRNLLETDQPLSVPGEPLEKAAQNLISLQALKVSVHDVGELLGFFRSLDFSGAKVPQISIAMCHHTGFIEAEIERPLLGVIETFKGLRSLKWTGPPNSNGMILSALVSTSSPALEELHLSYIATPDTSVFFTSRLWPQLRSLRLYMFDASTCIREMVRFLERHPTIEHFSHIAPPAKWDEQPRWQACSLPLLRSLDLNYGRPSRISYALSPMEEGRRRPIETLKINLELFCGSSELSFFKQASSLKKLKLGECLSPDHFYALAAIGYYATHVEELHFRNLSEAEERHIPIFIRVLSAFPSLRRVETSSLRPICAMLSRTRSVERNDAENFLNRLSAKCRKLERFGDWKTKSESDRSWTGPSLTIRRRR